jgi:hypothetical protein
MMDVWDIDVIYKQAYSLVAPVIIVRLSITVSIDLGGSHERALGKLSELIELFYLVLAGLYRLFIPQD